MLSAEERKAKERKLDAAAVNWKKAPQEDSRVYKNEILLLVFELYDREDQDDAQNYDPNVLLNALEEALAKYIPVEYTPDGEKKENKFSHYFSLLFSGRKKDAYRYKQRHAPDGDSLDRPVSEDGKLTLGEILPANVDSEPEDTLILDGLLGDLTSLILNFSKRKGRENNPSRLMWYQLFYTEDMTQVMKERMVRFLHERDIFSAMDLEYLDYYMSAPCRTGRAVMDTPLKPYSQVVPSRVEEAPVPVPIPGDVSICYLKFWKKVSGGASARSNQLNFYKTEKENLLKAERHSRPAN